MSNQEPDPYAHLPLMKRPDFVYSKRMYVRNRRIQVGDYILDRQYGPAEEKWKVTKVDATGPMVYVWFEGREKSWPMGLATDRIWVQRIPKSD